MKTNARLKVLQTQRNAFKGQLESFESFLTNYNKETDVFQLQLRLKRNISLFEKFDSMHDELDVLDNSDESKNERFIILDKYYKITGTAQQYVSEHDNEANRARNNNVNETFEPRCVGVAKRRLKLPQASIPTFNGQVEQWLSFKNSFVALIHERDDLSNVERLQYLRSSLSDEALKKIQLLSITDASYSQAWEILQKAYENKRILISRHLSLLLNLPKQDRDGHKSIEILADEAQQHMQSLSNLGVNLSPEIVVQIIEEKLNRYTRAKWEESLKRDEFPSLDHLIEFLYKIAASQSKQDNERKRMNSRNDDGPPAKHRKIESNAKVFTTTNKKCPCCLKENHPLFKCTKFREISVQQRIKIVKDAGLCSNCLRNHGNSECRYGNCRTCDKKHNSLLHIGKSFNNERTVDKESQDQKTT